MNKHKLLKISVVSLASLGLALSVFAQTPSATPKSEIRGVGEGIRQEIEQNREELRQKREEFKQSLEQKRQEFKNALEQKKEELKNKIEAERKELKQRLEKIKDERKKQTVDRVDKSLDMLNEKMTKHFLEDLSKLEDILAKISERTDRAEAKGMDVSSVDSAFAVAQTAINNAKTAIQEQASKNYVVKVSTEDKLKADVGQARQALHTDLKAVLDKVIIARDAVHDVARAFAKANGRDLPSPSPTATVSPTVSPTTSPVI